MLCHQRILKKKYFNITDKNPKTIDAVFLEKMILLEVENRGVQDALNNHFEAAKEKGRFDKVDARICDYDGCTYTLSNPDGNREKLQVCSFHFL